MATKDDLEQQLKKAQADIAALAKLAGERAQSAAGAAEKEVSAQLADLSDEARAMFEEARKSGQALRGMGEAQVRENPLLALGAAAAVGFLLARLTRR